MTTIRPHQYDPDSWDDEEDPATFERMRKQTGKPATVKGDRRQQEKEWGRAISKFHKQRARGNGKP
ncbi:MAG TPA: hypothetical protein VNL77_08200 [Roseiflexaceae bacterium]|nr:hypothetical protein [Roseiflexaceae bacterium]